ncbi:hypothetical protein ACFOSC_09440 [Streptantibioticus rubrisoli]|uniref:Uncharacterized protein n=1 Tax=Streptantibioticus rubrisoli TaxID=1387313 RepID=A0ABT1P9K8_9ACTN|nr:hypothetical protein [Streptantibioticus rubrisoli]MCQ4040933.1 hypothetical protein [Streptantibioticus rubrisoli]
MSALRKLASWELVGTPTEGVPTALARACVRVGHDLRHDATVRARLPELRWWAGRETGAPADFLVVGLATAQGALFGTGVNCAVDEAELTVRVAELTQDHLIGYEALPWPPCPDHDHPMAPCADDERACWCCGATGQALFTIGQLA